VINQDIKYFVIRNFRGTCSFVKMLKGYMLICWNAERVRCRRKVGNPCARELFKPFADSASLLVDIEKKIFLFLVWHLLGGTS